MREPDIQQAAMFSYLTREKELLSAEHFTVEGTLIQAWAASRSFHEKNDPPAPGPGWGKRGELLLRDKVESKTDPDARLYKEATADKSVPSYQEHALSTAPPDQAAGIAAGGLVLSVGGDGV